MSPADDVMEMQTLCDEIVKHLAGAALIKTKVGLLADELGVSFNRALEFLRGKARRVDSWEKDDARRTLADLRARQRAQRDSEHLAWLQEQIDRSRASGTEFRGAHVDGLEHFLRLARVEAGAVELAEVAKETTD